MAIEIKEFFLQLNLNDTKIGSQNEGAATGSGNNSAGCGSVNQSEKEEMVQNTVEEVLRILKEQKER